MEQAESLMRAVVVAEAYEAFGIVHPSRIGAVVKLTAGIPWFNPPSPGEVETRDLCFRPAVIAAATNCTHGVFTPAHIFEAAVEMFGRVKSESGHMSDRRWVKGAKAAPALVDLEKYTALPLPSELKELTDGS